LAIWRFITDLGDTAVTLPLALLMLCFLSAARQPGLAIAWVAAILGCVSMIGGLKLVLDVCGDPLVGTGLTSPSGHVAMSTVVYGGIAAAISASLAPPVRAALIANTTALIILMPLSRIVLRVHTPVEVVVGLAVGLASLVIIVATVAIRRAQLPVLWFAAAAILVAMFFHGERWPAEQAIHHLAGRFDLLRSRCNSGATPVQLTCCPVTLPVAGRWTAGARLGRGNISPLICRGPSSQSSPPDLPPNAPLSQSSNRHVTGY
jgi:membrane-associated phospholipid phosphatase